MRQHSTAISEPPIGRRACGYDVSDLPHVAGVRTCPEYGRGVAPDGSNTPPPHPPEVRCPGCGYNLAGIPGIRNTMHCPECGQEVDLVYGATLEPWPGDHEVIKQTLWFNPWGVVCSASFIFIALTFGGGRTSDTMVLLGVGIGAVLSVGEAVVQARKIAWACCPRQERGEVFRRMAMIGGGISLAIWAILTVATVAVLLIL